MGYLFLAIGLCISVGLSAASYIVLETPYQPALLALATLSACSIFLCFCFCVYLDTLHSKRRANQRENQQLKMLLEHGSSAMLLLNPKLEPEYINHRHATLTKLDVEDPKKLINTHKWKQHVAPETRRRIREAIAEGKAWQGELRFGDSEFDDYLATTITPIYNSRGDLSNIIVCCEDISEHKAIADRLFIREHYNVLTGLPNRQFALRSLSATIDKCAALQQQFMLIYIDLDRIRYINESLGHFVVDKVLIETAERLRLAVPDEQLIAHLGADEFLIILDTSSGNDSARELAEDLLERCRTPFYIEQHEVNISASVGLSQYPADGNDSNTLMRRAEAAMFAAKADSGNRFCFYDESMSHQADRRLDLESHLRHAIARNELELYYQPMINLTNHQLVGVEVLLRWHNSKLGNPAPDEFIPVAEHSGQIIAIGSWVLEQACKQIIAWSQAGLANLNVAVNISNKQFSDGDIVKNVAHALKVSGLPARQLELEITEGLLINDTPTIRRQFKELKSLGIHLSLDDFGTGYASLSYLKRYPFDTLKIDRSFVKDIDHCEDSVALTNAIIAMAHSFKMKVIAEGVENLNQRRILRERHCDMVQGYLYSPALPAGPFLEWAKRYAEMQHSKHV
ncbi:MAG: EAL domain-containing protein [Zhongshania sp.]|uniref:EAL domain-containing protein n=1 Tax=Zhongshania sp. TaxID=1971902 RepID=UPI00263804FE|nr:EAL domain-containing protein [Zhongshania sp.]MDF1692467.1 EAL domain-containing protein [Zhongshania sp.]